MAGEALIIFAAEAVMRKLVSFGTKETSHAWGLKANLKTLSTKSNMILALLSDAGSSQVKGEAVTLWLKNLKNAAYHADDLLEEFAFEMLRRKLEIQNRMKNKLRSFFSVSNPIAFCFKMAFKIKDINSLLDQVIKEGTNLGLQQVVHQAMESSRTSTSHAKIRHTQPFVDDSKVLGRDADKSKVVNMLLQTDSEETLPVVAIVGLAGIGKTTLAQVVFNDESVKRNFSQSHRMWVCVSDDFNITRILKEMTESLNLDTTEMSNIQALIQRLAEKLEGKKYLLVLDDVWETKAEEWDLLRGSLLGVNASKQSRILVTTRSDRVVSAAQTLQAHHLERLPEHDSWYIFQQRAFASGGMKETPYLVDIARKIVKRCGGVPLALKSIGALMHSREEHEWRLIEESNLWDSFNENSSVMAALRLNFDRLPLWSKQCFAYCSIFPKDFKFEKDNLIQLWIAQGFIQPSQERNLEMEDVGNDYFKSLLWISFFHDVEVDKYGNKTHYKMHDLVHDLGLQVSKSECLTLDADKVNIDDDLEFRHLSLGENEVIVQTIPNEIATRLRTLSLTRCACENFLMKFKHLRVLMLKGSKIEGLPTKIGKLKHLRYLDVSNTEITTFPKSITRLYNLQTLRVMDCKSFEEFPEELANLVNLKHLYFNYGKMPNKIGKLICLLTLPLFIVSQDSEAQIEELGMLCKLRGKLEIRNLERVRDKQEAKRAKLLGKANLYMLILAWINDRECADNDEDVLEGLQPPPNLKSLTIQDFLGGKLASWMMVDSIKHHSLLPQSLVEIKLIDCKRCENIPTLGELPFLRFLEIDGMTSMKYIGTEFYSKNDGGASSSNPGCSGSSNHMGRILFPALEKLSLYYMSNLVEFSEVEDATAGLTVVFPRLLTLIIRWCYKLVSIPSHFPSLTTFILTGVTSGVPIAQISSKVTTLRNFTAVKILELTSLPEELFQNNRNNLTYIRIKSCPKLSYIPPDGLRMVASSLDYLRIYECPSLKYIPSIEGLTSLRILKIFVLPNVPTGLGTCTSLQKLRMQSSTNLISVPVQELKELKYLRLLSITHCENLKSLPLEEFLHCLSRLEHLEIGAFSEELDAFPFISVDYIQQYLQRLQRVGLYGWPTLKSLPDLARHLPALGDLAFSEFNGVETLPEWLGDISCLQGLGIFNFANLKHLPSADCMRRLTNLKRLVFLNCPLMVERCNKETGTEWPKISHIPFVHVGGMMLEPAHVAAAQNLL